MLFHEIDFFQFSCFFEQKPFLEFLLIPFSIMAVFGLKWKRWNKILQKIFTQIIVNFPIFKQILIVFHIGNIVKLQWEKIFKRVKINITEILITFKKSIKTGLTMVHIITYSPYSPIDCCSQSGSRWMSYYFGFDTIYKINCWSNGFPLSRRHLNEMVVFQPLSHQIHVIFVLRKENVLTIEIKFLIKIKLLGNFSYAMSIVIISDSTNSTVYTISLVATVADIGCAAFKNRYLL